MRLILLLINSLLVFRSGICSQVDNFGPKFQQEADSPWTPLVMNPAFQPDQIATNSAQVSSQIQHQAQTPHQNTRNISPTQHAPAVVTQQTHRLIPLSPVVVPMPIEARAPAAGKRPRHRPFLWTNNKKHMPLPPKRDLNKKMSRREPMRKIMASGFLKKIARKVFFPDRRSDNHGNRRPQQHRSPPAFRFEQNGKVLFPQAQTQQQQFDTNRLRLAIQQALCAFSTVSTGMNGESCIES